MNALRTTLLLALVASLVGCGSCRGKEDDRASAAHFFPPDTQAFVAVEDPLLGAKLGALVEEPLAGLVATSLLPGGEDPFAPMVRELGFDPRSPEGFSSVGLDASRGMAWGLDDTGRPLAVIGVRDGRAAGRWLEERARRLGGRTRTERIHRSEEGEEREVVAYLDTNGGVRLAHAIEGKWLVAAQGLESVERVGEALLRAPSMSLAASAEFQTGRERLGAGRSIWGYMPGPKRRSRRTGLWDKGFSFAATVGEKEIDTRVRIPQGTLALSVLQSAASAEAKGDLLPFLSERDFLLLRIGGDPLALDPLVRSSLFYRRLRRAGLDPAKEILPLFQPGVLVGISLEPDPNLSGGLPTQPSLSATNPFHFVHTGILARVKDPEQAKAVLERVRENAERLRMQVKVREEGDVQIFTASYDAGEGLTWTLLGDMLLAAGGEGAFDALLERVRGKGKAYEASFPEAFELFASQPLALYFDVPRLATQLRAIPESAFGIGGFRLKAIVDGWTSSIESLRGLAIAYHVDNEGIVLDARVATE